MEIRKKIVRVKNVTQIPHYDSFITRDGDKLITRDGDLITWIRILSAYVTDVNYDGATYSFVEHYRLSNGTEAATNKSYSRLAPSVTITSSPVTEIVSANPTSWSSSIVSSTLVGEELYESYEGWNAYVNKYDIAAEYINEGVTYPIAAQAVAGSRVIYNDGFVTVNFTSATPTFSSSYTQNYIADTQVYNTDFIISTVSGSLTASDSRNVSVYMQTAITDFPAEWGKLLNVQHTVAPNRREGGSRDWVYVVALTFENRFFPIRVRRNGSIVADTACSTTNIAGLNCAVEGSRTNYVWVPSRGYDSPADHCMIWEDEHGTKINVLDYMTASIIGWNDGHNTVQNFATTSSISDKTLKIYLWGNEIASYKVLT